MERESIPSKPQSPSLSQSGHQFAGDMSPHHLLHPSEKHSAQKNRRKLRRTADDLGHIAFVELVDVENSRIDAVAVQQELDHVAHAAALVREHHHRLLRHQLSQIHELMLIPVV